MPEPRSRVDAEPIAERGWEKTQQTIAEALRVSLGTVELIPDAPVEITLSRLQWHRGLVVTDAEEAAPVDFNWDAPPGSPERGNMRVRLENATYVAELNPGWLIGAGSGKGVAIRPPSIGSIRVTANAETGQVVQGVGGEVMRQRSILGRMQRYAEKVEAARKEIGPGTVRLRTETVDLSILEERGA